MIVVQTWLTAVKCVHLLKTRDLCTTIACRYVSRYNVHEHQLLDLTPSRVETRSRNKRHHLSELNNRHMLSTFESTQNSTEIDEENVSAVL